VIAVSEGIRKELLREPPEFEGHYDPHVWMAPELWMQTIPTIVHALTNARPQYQKEFESRGDSLAQEIAKLQQWAEVQMAAIPQEQRVLVTAHDAFGYFGQHFKIEVRGLQGISTATDYGLADVTELVELLAARKIKGVFVESSVPTKPLEAVIEGCRARGHEVVIGGMLYSDAMGEAGTPDGTYIGMIRHNVETIAGALQ
jgi:manganese/zinc/iron transport system substrate-binding protein